MLVLMMLNGLRARVCIHPQDVVAVATLCVDTKTH
jgi:hypothetical protein